MGLISLVMSRKPSYGLSSRGFTIVAVTVAMTLFLSAKGDKKSAHAVFPIRHSTEPSSAPKLSSNGRCSSGNRPSRRLPRSSACTRNSLCTVGGSISLGMLLAADGSVYVRGSVGRRSQLLVSDEMARLHIAHVEMHPLFCLRSLLTDRNCSIHSLSASTPSLTTRTVR